MADDVATDEARLLEHPQIVRLIDRCGLVDGTTVPTNDEANAIIRRVVFAAGFPVSSMAHARLIEAVTAAGRAKLEEYKAGLTAG